MGVAKAALEASVRYLAADFGEDGIRVNALSPGPMRTLAGAGISDARMLFNYQRKHSPLKRTPTLDEVGGAALYLLSDLSGAVTGEVHFADCGYSITAMPTLGEPQGHGRGIERRLVVRIPGRSRPIEWAGVLDLDTQNPAGSLQRGFFLQPALRERRAD